MRSTEPFVRKGSVADGSAGSGSFPPKTDSLTLAAEIVSSRVVPYRNFGFDRACLERSLPRAVQAPGQSTFSLDETDAPVGFFGPATACLAPGFALDPTRARNQVPERVLFLATGHIDRTIALTTFSRHRSQLRVVIDRSRFASIDELAVCLNWGPPRSPRMNERSVHALQPGCPAQPVDRKASSPDALLTSHASARRVGSVFEGGTSGSDDHATGGTQSPGATSALRRVVLTRGPATVGELLAEAARYSSDPNRVRRCVDEFLDHDETVVLVPGTRECPDPLLTTAERMRLEKAIVTTASRVRRRRITDCLHRESGTSAMGYPDDLVDDILSGAALAIIDGPECSGKTEAACNLARRLSELGPHGVSLLVDGDRAAPVRHRLPDDVPTCEPGDIRGLAPADCYVVDAAEEVGAVDMANMLRRADRDGSAVVLFGNSRSAERRRGSPWQLLTDRFPVRNLFVPLSPARSGGRDCLGRFISEHATLESVFNTVVSADTRVRGAQSMDSLIQNAAKDFVEDPARGKIVLAATRAQAAAINREVLTVMGNRRDTTEIKLADGSSIPLAGGDPVRVVAAEPEVGLRDNVLAEVVAASADEVLLDLDPFSRNETASGGQRFVLLSAEHIVLDHAFADTFWNSIDVPGSRHLVFNSASRGQSIRSALFSGRPATHIHVQDEDPSRFLARTINTTGWTNPAADLAPIRSDAWRPRLQTLTPQQLDGIDPVTGGWRQETANPAATLPDGIRIMEGSGIERALNAWIRLTATEMAMDFGSALEEWSIRCGEDQPVSEGRQGPTGCFHGRGNRFVIEAMDTMRAQPAPCFDDRPDLISAGHSRIALVLAVAFTESAPPGHIGHKLDIHAKILGMMAKIAWPEGNWFERAIADLHVFRIMRHLRKKYIRAGHGEPGERARTPTLAPAGSGTVDATEIVARLLVAISPSGSIVESDIVRTLNDAMEADAIRKPDELIAARSERLGSMMRPQWESLEDRFIRADPGVGRPLFTTHEIRALLNPGTALPRTLPDLSVENRRHIARNGRSSRTLTVDAGRRPNSGLAPPIREGFSW